MRRTIQVVIGTHLILVLILAINWKPKPQPKQPIVVRTKVLAPPPPPPPAPKPVSIPKPAPKPKSKPKPKPKPITKAKPSPKAKPLPKKKEEPLIAPELLQDLQKSIAKIEQNRDKGSPIKQLPKLKAEEVSFDVDIGPYQNLLIEAFQKGLHLPERGEVKVELTLSSMGQVVALSILSSGSRANEALLKKRLKEMVFPRFSGALKGEKEHAFVITFCNQ